MTHPMYAGSPESNRVRRRCQLPVKKDGKMKTCGHNCCFYCVTCSQGDKLFSLCGINTTLQCVLKHCQ